jgi:hypothetical protein
MPFGGGYDGSDATRNLLHGACPILNDGSLLLDVNRAKPSFCSGATYLVLLKAMNDTGEEMRPEIDPRDGHGVFGRWNSNGPGAAKLVADLGAGINFTGSERGHHVIYLGHNAETVRFWSSNQPGGYGKKSVPRRECRRVLFTRITCPEKFATAQKLPPADPWLAAMLHEDFTWDEVAAKCRLRE